MLTLLLSSLHGLHMIILEEIAAVAHNLDPRHQGCIRRSGAGSSWWERSSVRFSLPIVTPSGAQL